VWRGEDGSPSRPDHFKETHRQRAVPYTRPRIGLVPIFVNLTLSSSVNTGFHRPESRRTCSRRSDMRCQVLSARRRGVITAARLEDALSPGPTLHVGQLKRYRVLQPRKTERLSIKGSASPVMNRRTAENAERPGVCVCLF